MAGKENPVDVIKYEGDNKTFIWKHPTEDFNTLTQLIVHQSQEAVFFLNGEALDSFGPGKYTLETQAIPLISKRLFGKITGDSPTPFHAEVYFINLTEQMGIRWGTDSRVNYVDPTNNNAVFQVGASGEYSLKVTEPRKLLIKLVGTENFLSQSTLADYFRPILQSKIKAFLPNVLKAKQVSIFDLDSYTDEFSQQLHALLAPETLDYGVTLQKFWITTIQKPEDDPAYRKLNELRSMQITAPTEAMIDQQVTLIGAETNKRTKMMETDATRYDQDQLGYSYAAKRAYDVMEAAAANEGSGSDVRGAAMGIGMGFGMGGAFGGAISQMANTTLTPTLVDPLAGTQQALAPAAQAGPPPLISLKNDQAQPAADPAPATSTAAGAADPAQQRAFCADCGAALEPGDAFCPECGSPTQAQPACKSCGFQFTNSKPFCPKCGTKREDV
ncbi:MAG: SPFH domain-containing protein [Coriobacteriales bacterium]|jgi:membrane protease subunit (stomatin/prohibitin family)/RNA polymerase subunit RPABC4/transcription elongation factor Spt4|nr:SPFH domain-containing protein [Coriobacteriales bacterium]